MSGRDRRRRRRREQEGRVLGERRAHAQGRAVQPSPDSDRRAHVRVAARVLLVDPAQRLLLFEGSDPHVPDEFFWFTAGGGVEQGEELPTAALRELREETGLQVAADRMVGPVWLRRVRFSFEGVDYDSEVEVAVLPAGDVAVRDTKDRGRVPHAHSAPAWTAFLAGVRAGEFGPR